MECTVALAVEVEVVKVLQVTSWDAIGARFNGSAIHRALLGQGHDSQMCVFVKHGNDPSVFLAGSRLSRGLDNRLLGPLERRLSLQSLLVTSGSMLAFSRAFREADVVHLQLIHASRFFSLVNLPIMARRQRLVWTIHDPWMLTGHCVYPMECDRWRTGCGRCPDLSRPLGMRRDRTALMWRAKKRLVQRSGITLVVASRYMDRLVSQSPILRSLPRHLIPFGVPIERFHPNGRAESRARLDIPAGSDVVAFRFRGIDEPFKGGRLLLDALLTYQPRRPTTLVVLESGDGLEVLEGRYDIRRMGWLDDEARLAEVYRASDVFLMPSAAEAFGLMAIEAMACGTPVVVCEGTSLPDVIRAPRGGVAVPQGDPGSLAGTLESLLASPSDRRMLGDEAVRLVREAYSQEAYVRRHIDLYQRIQEG